MLRAVVFDVDGTLAATERHGHRVAFNRAFERAGLPYRWDEHRYGELVRITGGSRRVRHFLAEECGMDDASAEALAVQLHAWKTRMFAELARSGGIPPRPGVVPLLDDLAAAGIRLAVATTGRREWVLPLLEHIIARARRARFDVIVTGDDVTTLKPDPEAFQLAVALLGTDPASALAVEDSWNGVRAARTAGLTCLGVLGEYGTPEELQEADLVTDGFGGGEEPAVVLHNPHGITAAGRIDATLLERLHECARRRADPVTG